MLVSFFSFRLCTAFSRLEGTRFDHILHVSLLNLLFCLLSFSRHLPADRSITLERFENDGDDFECSSVVSFVRFHLFIDSLISLFLSSEFSVVSENFDSCSQSSCNRCVADRFPCLPRVSSMDTKHSLRLTHFKPI